VVRKLGLEGGLLRTIVDLSIRPAWMIRQYIDGRRQRYTNPVAYLLLTAGAYVLFSTLWRASMEAGLRLENADAEGLGESLVKLNLYLETHPAVSTLVVCLFLVPALRLLFRKTTNTAEASVFSLFVFGHVMLIQLALNLAAIMFAANPYAVMTGWLSLMPALILLFSAGRFFGSSISATLKLALALAIALVGLVVLLVMAAAILIAATSTTPTAAAL
jgi:hypothetical protein